MKSPRKILITVGSWEARFYKGSKKIIRENNIDEVILFRYEEYLPLSDANTSDLKAFCEKEKISLREHHLSFSQLADSWKETYTTLSALSHVDVTVDISTMPREAIWHISYSLRAAGIVANYIYHRPNSYSDWLSKNPGEPRLIYKQSGISYLSRPTCVLITTGFDPYRTKQILDRYEPQKVLLGFQTGDQFNNLQANIEAHENVLKGMYSNFVTFKVNAYSDDFGFSSIHQALQDHIDEYNILVTSLGPKTTAVALSKVTNLHPEIGIIYAPSNEYHHEYSSGIGSSYSMML